MGGGNPISLSEYYGLSASITLPTNSQPINVGIFRGVSKFVITATNATISENIYTFTTNGTFNINGSARFDILVVGGGGGGGWSDGGGGGGGGVVYQKNVQLDADTYTINIGAGGERGLYFFARMGKQGGSSSITYTSSILNKNGISYEGIGGGGGGGGYYDWNAIQENGGNGGSGGGGGGGSSPGMGISSGGAATQGNTFWNGSENIQGGQNGANETTLYRTGAAGGGSFNVDITGTNVLYGVGGRNSSSSVYGGGGANNANGSSGVVIFKYLGR